MKAYKLVGRYAPAHESDADYAPRNTVPFFGHRVGQDTPHSWHEETRLAYKTQPPLVEEVGRLFYSERGMAWLNGTLDEKYSVAPVRLADVRNGPPATARKMAACAIVQCDCVYTYGDWTHCFLGTILAAELSDVPVLIPRHLAEKSYVKRDLDLAGINWIATDGWVDVSNAIVLRKPNPLTYWSDREVTAYRKAFDIAPVTPAVGSVSYLGRFDLQGEVPSRPYPSDAAAQYTVSIGGQVIPQKGLNTLTSSKYTGQAETVIGDHGSGMLNILFWQPKTVIELVVNDWWVNNTLFVAAAMGVQNLGVIKVDGLSAEQIGQSIAQCQAHFEQGPGSSP